MFDRLYGRTPRARKRICLHSQEMKELKAYLKSAFHWSILWIISVHTSSRKVLQKPLCTAFGKGEKSWMLPLLNLSSSWASTSWWDWFRCCREGCIGKGTFWDKQCNAKRREKWPKLERTASSDPLDEQMIPLTGRSGLMQYVRGKSESVGLNDFIITAPAVIVMNLEL